jgi:hypothetical protein
VQDYLRVPWLIGLFTLTLVTIDTSNLVGWVGCVNVKGMVTGRRIVLFMD